VSPLTVAVFCFPQRSFLWCVYYTTSLYFCQGEKIDPPLLCKGGELIGGVPVYKHTKAAK